MKVPDFLQRVFPSIAGKGLVTEMGPKPSCKKKEQLCENQY